MNQSNAFIKSKDLEWEEVAEGVKRKIVGYNNQIMMVVVHFDKGGVGVMHQHFHSQVTYVESGEFEVTIDGVTETLKQGDSFYIEPNKLHGAVCTQAGVLIDVFSPIREDFME